MIIVLGMDNTGKSTLVSELSERLGIPSKKSLGPATHEEQSNWIMNQVALKESIIYDRFVPFEEMVYGGILRDKSNFYFSSDEVVKLKDKKPLIIYCRPTKETIKSFGEREQMDGVIDQSDNLIEAFDYMSYQMVTRGWNVVKYDFENDDIRRIVNIIKMLGKDK